MTFFVLGFKDILAATYSPSPTSLLEENLNTHCEEDADHWLWFLDDLATLEGMSLVGHKKEHKPSDTLSQIWSSKGFAVRRQTYALITLLHEEKCPRRKLIIIECLESAFSAFISNLTFMTKSFGLYESLKYFGREHHHDEAQHSMGSWLDGERHNEDIDLNGDEQEMLPVIQKIFSGFNDMFDVWYSDIEEQKQPLTTESNIQELLPMV